MDLPRERVRRKRVPQALHRMGLHLGPFLHWGESAPSRASMRESGMHHDVMTSYV